MYDGSRQLGMNQIVLYFIFLLLSTIGVYSQVGSDRTTTSIPFPGSPGCYQDDRCTLRAFKKGLLNEGEPELASWTKTNVTRWKGVTWRGSGDGTLYVEKLELAELNLNGIGIAPLLHDGLTNMTFLSLSGNFFGGELPHTLRICPALLVLDLSNNSFFGKLPQVFSCDDRVNTSASHNLATFTSINLRALNLSMNNFSGEVWSSLFSTPSSAQGKGGNLSNLTSLVLDKNSFGGSFPSSIGNCKELVELRVEDNFFSGIFPFYTLQKLEKLQTVEATGNFITGKLQVQTDGEGFKQLKTLRLGYNWLSGGIPESLGNLSNLEILELKYNNLTGSIPKTLAKLANLETLTCQFNALNGTIPDEFSQLSSLATLSLNRNKLRGSISPRLSNCTKLKSIWLSQNALSGAIPPALGNLTDLQVLSMYGNYLNASIPEELGRLSNLIALDLSWNLLVGKIPDGLCNIFQFQVFLLNNNQLNGSIPNCFGNYTYLRIVDFSSNILSGSFPDDLTNLSMNVHSLSKASDALSAATYIQALAGQNLVFGYSESPITYIFANNLLSGQIPPAFGSIQNLQQLRLNNNNLSGPIPEALGNASSLYWLDLSFNDLSGPIPSSLTDLNFLSFLNVSFNGLSGPIPLAAQFTTFTNLSYVGNPGLCGYPVPALCHLLPDNAPSYGLPSSHDSFVEDWVSYRAFGVGVIISFTLLSGFFMPLAYASGKRARDRAIVPIRHEQYGLFLDPQ